MLAALVCLEHVWMCLICVFLRRVDKDRSGVISDTELQQALSNGSYHCPVFLNFCQTPKLVSSVYSQPLCSLSVFPIFVTPPLSPLWSLRLSPVSWPRTISLKPKEKKEWDFIFIPEWRVKWMKLVYFYPREQVKPLSAWHQRTQRCSRNQVSVPTQDSSVGCVHT